MNTRVKELNKEIKHLNIDRSKCVDEGEQLSPGMEASVSTYSRNSLARTWMARTPWSAQTFL